MHYHVRAEGVPSTIVVAVPNYFHTVDFNRGDTVFIGVQSASVIDLGNDSQTQNIENGEFTT